MTTSHQMEKKHLSKQVVSITCTLEEKFFAAVTSQQAQDVYKTSFLGLFKDFILWKVNQTPLKRLTKRRL